MPHIMTSPVSSFREAVFWGVAYRQYDFRDMTSLFAVTGDHRVRPECVNSLLLFEL